VHLLDAVYAADAPPVARTLPAVQLVRRVWLAEYQVSDGLVQQRAPDNMPPGSARVESPYDPEARFSVKRSTEWSGYKVHMSETATTICRTCSRT
jgi:transposase